VTQHKKRERDLLMLRKDNSCEECRTSRPCGFFKEKALALISPVYVSWGR